MNDTKTNDLLFRIIEETKPQERIEVSDIPESENETVAEIRVNESQEDYIEIDDEFDFEGFQVVRREFFAHLTDPSLTFNNYKVSVNAACLNKFPDTDYVLFMVNKETKILAIKPCNEEDRDACLWCTQGNKKRKPRQATCKLFFATILNLMGWNPDYRYKLLGKMLRANNQYMLVFDLTATEMYKKTDGARSRTPIYPESWQNQFGMPYEEHRKSYKIETFDGFSTFKIMESPKQKQSDEASDNEERALTTMGGSTPTVNGGEHVL